MFISGNQWILDCLDRQQLFMFYLLYVCKVSLKRLGAKVCLLSTGGRSFNTYILGKCSNNSILQMGQCFSRPYCSFLALVSELMLCTYILSTFDPSRSLSRTHKQICLLSANALIIQSHECKANYKLQTYTVTFDVANMQRICKPYIISINFDYWRPF